MYPPHQSNQWWWWSVVVVMVVVCKSIATSARWQHGPNLKTVPFRQAGENLNLKLVQPSRCPARKNPCYDVALKGITFFTLVIYESSLLHQQRECPTRIFTIPTNTTTTNMNTGKRHFAARYWLVPSTCFTQVIILIIVSNTLLLMKILCQTDLQTCSATQGSCQARSQKSPDDRSRVEGARGPTEPGLDSLHDSPTR